MIKLIVEKDGSKVVEGPNKMLYKERYTHKLDKNIFKGISNIDTITLTLNDNNVISTVVKVNNGNSKKITYAMECIFINNDIFVNRDAIIIDGELCKQFTDNMISDIRKHISNISELMVKIDLPDQKLIDAEAYAIKIAPEIIPCDSGYIPIMKLKDKILTSLKNSSSITTDAEARAFMNGIFEIYANLTNISCYAYVGDSDGASEDYIDIVMNGETNTFTFSEFCMLGEKKDN